MDLLKEFPLDNWMVFDLENLMAFDWDVDSEVGLEFLMGYLMVIW